MTSISTPSAKVWSQICDQVAEDALRFAGYDSAPVNAFDLAQRMGVEVAYDATQTSRGRLKRLRGRPTMFLAPDQRPERLQWAAAHELGEAMAMRVFERLDIDRDETSSIVREKTATELAAAILLPWRWFVEDAVKLDADLFALKRIYSTASHEMILNRLMRLETLTIISVFDQGELTRRRSNGRLEPPPLFKVELDAQRLTAAEGERIALTGSGVRVQAWAVHEPGWKRELLRTTPLDEDPLC